MANLSPQTRKAQVLRYLEQHADQWVDGPDLANAQVGGSEGLKRVRELRADGHRIITRPHPNRSRDVFQYRLVSPERIAPVVQERLDQMLAQGTMLPPGPAPITPTPITPAAAGRPFLMRRSPDGSFELTKEVCVECGGMYDDDLAHRTSDRRHLRWVEASRKQADQLTVGVPEQPPPYKFTSMPERMDMATMAICPRCRGFRRPGRAESVTRRGIIKAQAAEDFTRDPYRPSTKGEPNPCERCGGFGVVPQHVEEPAIAKEPDEVFELRSGDATPESVE